MKNFWNSKWKTILVWVSAYLDFVAFVLVGGYFLIKKEDEEVVAATKNAFIVRLIFAAVSGFFSIFHYIGGLTDNYYSSSAYDFYSTMSNIINIARIIVFAVFIIIALVKQDGKKETEKEEIDD